MRKLLLILALVLLVGAGWYFASPWLAMRGVVEAAQEGDEAALEERIDFVRLREGARADLREEIARRTEGRGILGQFGGALAGEIAGGALDVALTPEGFTQIVTAGAVTAPLVPARYRSQDLSWEVERDGLGSFRAVSTFEDGTAGPVLLFERDGFGWKLVGIELAEL